MDQARIVDIPEETSPSGLQWFSGLAVQGLKAVTLIEPSYVSVHVHCTLNADYAELHKVLWCNDAQTRMKNDAHLGLDVYRQPNWRQEALRCGHDHRPVLIFTDFRKTGRSGLASSRWKDTARRKITRSGRNILQLGCLCLHEERREAGATLFSSRDDLQG